MNKVYIGTSGYSYPYWKNRFYPEKLAASKWLAYYATQFNTVELNSSFYRFPTVKNLQKSASVTPDDFKFTVKAHKIITHTLRLRDAKEKIKEFTDIIYEGLQDKLACILYQLPPSYSYTEERMQDVIDCLGNDIHNVVEFRHMSWWTKEVFDTLKKNKISFCSVSYPNLPEDNIATTNLFYKRMHGVPQLFKSSYSETELTTLADSIPKTGEIFIYFNNTTYEAGYENALLLNRLITEK
jgi:uncharacterized protein YecE (DUF72 family)